MTKVRGIPSSQMGLPVSLEVAHKSWTWVSYTSSAGLTFPEPQGSYSVCSFISGLGFHPTSREERVVTLVKHASAFTQANDLAGNPPKHYSVVNVLWEKYSICVNIHIFIIWERKVKR